MGCRVTDPEVGLRWTTFAREPGSNPIRAPSRNNSIVCTARTPRSPGGARFVVRGPDTCLGRQNGSAGSLWITRNGTELVSFASQTQIVSRWRIDGSGPVSRRLGNGYEPISYSPDGQRLIRLATTATAEPTDLAVLDAATGEASVPSLDGSSPDGRATAR